MVDNDIKAGRQAVERTAQDVARETNQLGPGTAGFTTSGAAYRGKEVAANHGLQGPEEIGFTQDTGLGYTEPGEEYALNDYEPSQHTR